MTPSKRERDYARRRYNDWQARQHAKAMRARQARLLGLGAIGVLGLVAILILVVVAVRGQTPKTVAASATATASSTATPSGDNPCRPIGNVSLKARTAGKQAPEESLAKGRIWVGTIETTCGDLKVSLDGQRAPKAVANFLSLAEKGYFDDTKCHRLTTSGIYVLQCGDPTATGKGTPGYNWGPIENAPESNSYRAGTLAMARVGNDPNSHGSQFFIVYKDSTIPSDSAGGYTVFGTVTEGLNHVQDVARGGTASTSEEPARPIAITSVEVQ